MLSYNDLNHVYVERKLGLSSFNLTSLNVCPNHITGPFDCSQNRLSSLVGGPQIVDGYYICYKNQLTDLVGCASNIRSILNISDNPITSLVGIHKIIKSCPEIYFDCKPIKEGGIGLLLIENLTNFSDFSDPFNIISKYLGTGTKGMMECRKELIFSGYSDYAKL